ncbi:MAG TPA: hypothetical protein VGQ09_01820 [Chitinophagaceae bacterium]|jgi:hypothetical protein|nr:hypothetical protein [Chitinophagaceae bacterium]
MNNSIPLFITNDPPATTDQYYAELRSEAIGDIQIFSGSEWTDHNEHDTGITTIDAICFALTEQGHLNNISARQLLQLYGKPDALVKDFFNQKTVLHNAPVTLYDWRKFLIDQDTVRNAWLLPLTSEIAPQLFFKNNQYSLVDGLLINLKGLYDVLLEWSPDQLLGELNGNIISISRLITLPTGVQKTYWADLIFPFTWDTTDTNFIIFRNILNIQTITLQTANPLHPQLDPQIDAPGVYFSDLKITYNIINTATVSIILRINTEISTDLERQTVENEFISFLSNINGPLAAYNKIIAKAFLLSGQIKDLLLDKRNLAEDFITLRAINIQEIGIQAEIELTPGINVEEVLAELFFMLDAFISPDFTFQSYNAIVTDQNEDILDEIREGPFLQHGYLSDAQLRSAPGRSIFLSDILHIMLEGKNQLRHDKIIAVYNLSIQSYINNKPAGASEENCLRLVDDLTYRPRLSIFKSQIIVRERGVNKPYDISSVFAKFQNMKNNPAVVTPLLPALVAITDSELVPAAPGYYPMQYEYPAFYDLSISEKTAVNAQMRGYLFFFEQVLADLSTLFRHVPDLLSIDNVQLETRFPANLRQLLPFYDDYLKSGYEAALATPVVENESRRSLLLDHLLARLGEDFRYYGSWNNKTGNALNLAKYNFLKAMPTLAETRYEAYNYSKPSWNTTNISVTEKKLVHLLQLPDDLRKTRWKDPAPHFSIVTIAGPPVVFGFRITDALNAPLLKSPTDNFSFSFEAQDAATSVIQWGREIENYQIISTGPLFQFVVLNNELDIIAISENSFITTALALSAAQAAVTYFSTQWVPEEGLHLLENILLRPRVYNTPGLNDTLFKIPLLPDNTIAPGFGKDLYSQQVLVALPSVGDRFGDAGFQEVASAVIERELPAWLQVRVVWLNIFMMHDFESAYQTWVQTLSNPAATETVVQAAKDAMIKVLDGIHDWLSKKS